ncbi:low molecular weight protein tyrosine phosphatase family protein [Sphingomonas morindae]|uniref:Low molecular weight protein tyrosine phosphatase family protein n=1 Tax=Sphingomonas morindae TaxID=1541170 RepID=A0ABY4XA19_9SPHN|nr:low molecular weight protein tyrosine phosphatase family protein [Sphingomonas morindae]USI73550.1 low molecular weight protein tyrosine phosphatase family protein [Sphingomonas morindae]
MSRPRTQTVLFVCSQNRLRSPTAEQVFSRREGLEVDSAGTNHDADNPLTAELVAWADVIFVMEKAHRSKLQRRFRAGLGGRRVICLDIPDDYDFMQPELIRLLEIKVSRHLPAMPVTQEPKALIGRPNIAIELPPCRLNE